ncbi:hypothetical protein [Janthinobacterium sp. P210005]|uniref:hypothetical protein n=1 Tax=Janthinobacterium sp. P210005 TaxID=3112938 RepID=UPI002E258670|nr:hypothetical protein [Janthinobacterium sp. P210005]
MKFSFDVAAFIVSVLALLSAIFSVFYAKKQSEIAASSRNNDKKSYLAQYHDSYRLRLIAIQEKYRKTILDIGSDAGDVLNKIGLFFDAVNVGCDDGIYHRPLRHLSLEAAEMIACAFKGHLGWQPGIHMAGRLHHMIDLESDINSVSNYVSSNFRRELEGLYFSNVNSRQEYELLKDIGFCKIVSELKCRMDPRRAAEFLMKMSDALSSIDVDLSLLRKSAAESVKEINDILEVSRLDQFSIDESPKISRGLRNIRNKLDVLSEMRFLMVDSASSGKFQNYMSIAIYNCVILFCLQSFSSWGWDEER